MRNNKRPGRRRDRELMKKIVTPTKRKEVTRKSKAGVTYTKSVAVPVRDPEKGMNRETRRRVIFSKRRKTKPRKTVKPFKLQKQYVKKLKKLGIKVPIKHGK